MRRAPNELDARRNLAMLSAQDGDHTTAVSIMGDAVALQPTDVEAWKLLGRLNVESQRELEAQQAFTRALALDPADVQARSALDQLEGLLGKQASDLPPPPQVRSPASSTVDLRVTGTEADVQFLQGVIQKATKAQSAGNHVEASQLWATATRLQPDSAQLFMSRATSEYWANDMNAAASSYLIVVQLEPANYKARMYAGRAMHESRRYDESRAIFREAITVEPSNWEGYNMLGSQIMQSQNHTLMGEAVMSYKRAGQLQPRDPAPLVNLGHAYRESDRLDEAKSTYSAAIDLIHADDSVGEFAGRATLADGLRIRMAGLLPRVIQSEAAMLSSRGAFVRQLTALANAEPSLTLADPPTEVGGVITFNLNYMGFNDRRVHRTVAELYERAAPHLLEIAPHCYSPGLSHPPPPSEVEVWTASTDWSGPQKHYRRAVVRQSTTVDAAVSDRRRIRLGFVSANLKDHTIGKLFSATVVKLDRSYFDVTVFTFNGPVDGKSKYVHSHDGATMVLDYKLAPARAAIAAAELDVLFYPDIGLDTLTYFLSFARLAPVQVMTWGHPVTSATRHMDYFISSQQLEPVDGDDEYTETVVRLPHIPVSFERPQLPSDIAAVRARRSEYFGLGIDADDTAGRINLYACPQSLFKFHPDFDEAIGRILSADPRGRLIIVHASSTSTELLEATVERMTAAIVAATQSSQANEVRTPPSQQIIVVPHQRLDDYFRLCGSVDVLLDTFPFGGGNTHYEALSTGTPVITLRTRQMRGRITPALYHRLGIDSPEHGLVARSITEYVQLALRMGTKRDANAVARDQILTRVAALYEDTVGIRELERWLLNVSYPTTKDK